MGCHFLLVGVFLTQGSNPYLLCPLNWQADFSFSFYHCTASLCVRTQSCPPLCGPVDCRLPGSSARGICGLQSARLFCLWNLQARDTGVGCHFLLQGIFLTQGSNLSLMRWQVDSSPLCPPGKPLFVHVQTSISDNAIKNQVTKGKV